MGGGLGFLNKKTWHPGRMQNQERLWKAEEDAAAEQRSLAELRTKIEDERGREELRQAAIAGGHQKCVLQTSPWSGWDEPRCLANDAVAACAVVTRTGRSRLFWQCASVD